MKPLLILSALLLIGSTSFAVDFLKLFPQKKPIIAAIKGESVFRDQEQLEKAKKWVLEQAEIAHKNGMDGFLLEFEGGGILDKDISDKQMAAMIDITKATIQHVPQLVVGVEILWHFPGSTLRLAKESGARFVRIDFFSDEVQAAGLRVPIDPQGLLVFRKKLGAENIALLTDIQVKYSKMLDAKIRIEDSALKAKKLGSDGVIVSGAKSGSSADSTKFLRVQRTVSPFPILTGSGFSLENAALVLPFVDAVIVGTSISEKTGGPLIPEKVKALMSYVNEYRRTL